MRNIRHNIHTLSLAHNTVCKYANGTFSVIVNGTTVTRFPGFNCAINTLGMWNDTTQGTWSLIEATKDSMVVRVSLQLLPMTQTWTFKAVNGELSWHIDAEIEEWLCIEEFRCLCILNPLYQQWTADEYRKTFPRFNATYNPILLGEVRGEFVGVEEYNGKTFLPSFRFYNKDSNLLPLIQNFPAYNRAHAIGFRQEIFSSYSDFEPNMYPLFDGVVKIGKDVDIGKKGPASQGLPHSRSQHVCDDNRSIDRPLRVALVNLPWQRDGKRGIRAGSRWPHISDYSEGDYLPFPFFLAYATSLLQNHGIEAIIIDAIASGMTEEKFIEHIRSLDLDYLVAETSIPSFDYDRALLHRISSVGIPIILCGPVAHMCFEKFLKDHTFISYILCGEYEFTLLGLIRALQQNDDLGKVHGIVYRDGHVFKKTPQRPLCDINLLPWPHRETLPMHLYLDAPGEMLTPSVQILASRGCPFPCQFCLWPQVMYQGRTYRTRDVTNVIDEMEHLVKQQGFRSVYFDDDTFNIGKERMLEFCREIRKRGLEKTQWAIMARADLMDEEILDEMKLSGVWAIKYGVESASQSLVDNIGKSMDLKETEAMIRYTQKLGIRTHLTFTFGLPGETHETIEKTTQWALELNPFSIQFSIMTPFPGTKYYDYLKEKGQIVSHDLAAYDGHFKSVIKLDSLSPEDLEQAKARACLLWDEHVKKRRIQNGNVEVSDMLLIQCPPWDNSMPPLGIAYLANYLRHNGTKVAVDDLNAHLSQKAPECARYLWEQRSYDLWHDHECFKNTWGLIKEITIAHVDDLFRRNDPICVGLSVNAAGISFAAKLIQIIKERKPTVRIVVGGWGCINAHMRSLYPWDSVDAFVVGEGEETIKEVVDVLKGNRSADNIPGVVFTSTGEKAYVPRKPVENIDTIPWPTFREFDLSLYTTPVLPIFASRGCIGHCSFCNDWPVSKPYRYRTAWNIFGELEHHVKKYNIHVFSFKDLLCNGNIHQLDVFCDLVINSGLEIHWDSQAISHKGMTFDLLVKMKKAGCSTLIYGIESFSNNVLRRMKKLFDAETCQRVLRDTHNAGIQTITNIIVGFPGETEEDFEETLEALRRNREYIAQVGAVSTCLINGESELEEKAAEYGIEMSDDCQIRAKKWWSSDGQNTYELRRERAERVLALLAELDYNYATVTM